VSQASGSSSLDLQTHHPAGQPWLAMSLQVGGHEGRWHTLIITHAYRGSHMHSDKRRGKAARAQVALVNADTHSRCPSCFTPHR
jgi:hypothetical protein